MTVRWIIRGAVIVAGAAIFVLFYGWVLICGFAGPSPMAGVMTVDVIAAVFLFFWSLDGTCDIPKT